jgi:5S rRNA maturation endonuclease (ribonuclease M5)
MESFETVRSALESNGLRVQLSGNSHIKAQCPAHDDRAPSLSVDHNNDRTLVLCHAGCQTEDIVGALGLKFEDLFDGELPERGTGGVPIRSYAYTDFRGDPWIIKDRYFPKFFQLRLPDTLPGDRRGLKGRPPVLYHLPQLLAAQGKRVLYVEGEKDVEAAEKQGEIATTQPYGAGARWDEAYTQAFRRAKPSEVWVVVDQDEKGRIHSATVRGALRSADIPVRMVRAKEGNDLSDHLDAGWGIEDLLLDRSASMRPRGMTGDELMGTDFPPLKWAIPHLLPAGLAILAASPKAGKSWCALDFGLAVACGGFALGGIEASQGSVLYLAREDGYRRVQSRLDLLLANKDADLSRFEVIPTEEAWAGGQEGLAALSEWAEETDSPTLVVLDTLAKVEPAMEDGDRYRQDYAMMAGYKTFADRYNCSVLVVHHDRKSNEGDGDVFTKISGTRGITGAADTMMYLQRKRGEPTGVLHITGRDVADQELELRKSGPLWIAVDRPERAHLRAVD